MPKYNSDPIFLHPILHAALPDILNDVTNALPSKWKAKTSSQGIHRTPNEQFALYKKGRKFVNGEWEVVDSKKVVTYKDGFENKSRHNYLGSTAVDIILIRPDGTVLDAGKEEKQIKVGAANQGFEWGGDFPGNFKDLPHIQLPLSRLYKNNLEMDEALQWQKYLFHAGALTKEKQLDGRWGTISADALNAFLGQRERTPDAWESLFNTYGAIESMHDFDGIAWIPKVV